MTQNKIHEIILDETENQDVREALWQGIKAFNKDYFGERTNQHFSLTIRDKNAKIIAGLNGFIFLDHARVGLTWIDERYRRQGMGRKLFKRLEEYCRSKGCRVIQLDTFDFQAPLFYEKMGFEYIGTVSEWTCGHDCHFMRKLL